MTPYLDSLLYGVALIGLAWLTYAAAELADATVRAWRR